MTRLRVLAADDDPEVRALIERVCRGHDAAFDGAADGREALHRLEQEPFDIVLLDLIMPLADGSHVFNHAHPLCKNTAFVIMSSLDDQGIIQSFLDKGASAYLIKPLHEAIITEVLHRTAAGTLWGDHRVLSAPS